MRKKQIDNTVGAIALVVAAALIIVLPVGFGIGRLANLVNDLDFKASLNAERVAKYIFSHPTLWEFHTVRLGALIELPAAVGDTISQSIVTAGGRIAYSDQALLERPVFSRSASIVVQGEEVGRLVIEASLRPWLMSVGKVALIAFVLAGLSYGAFHRWPKRTIDRTMQALHDAHAQTVKALIELEHTDEELRQRSNQLIAAQEIGRIGDWTLAFGSGDMTLSQVARSILRIEAADALAKGVELRASLEADGPQRFDGMMSELVRKRGTARTDLRFCRNDGSVVDLAVIARVMEIAGDRVTRVGGTIQDITERKDAERRLEKLAYYDPLTGLANRTLFKRELATVLRQAQRHALAATLLLIDLDRFKEVNDSLGHAMGDELLTKAARMIGAVTEMDAFFARLGGDEFAIVVKGERPVEDITRLAQSIVDTLANTIPLGNHEVAIGASIGIVRIPEDGNDPEEITKNADLALYRAKDLGRGRYVFFEREMNELIQHKVALARDLRAAANGSGSLEVWFQPQLNLATGTAVGFEALMRWKHPLRGYIPPSEFIPIAESSSLICDIGLWIMRESARIAKAWIDAGGAPYEIAVNLSAAQIWQTDIEADVADVLATTGLPPHLLCLELTESLFADHAESRVRTALSGLKALGVQLALDDFGTGYSSLGYLAQLPFDKLKVDRLFIAGASRSAKALHVLQGIVALGHGLGMTVVAEGIERPDELARLREFGCDFGQGYLFAQPEPAAEALLSVASLPSMLHNATDGVLQPLLAPLRRETAA